MPYLCVLPSQLHILCSSRWQNTPICLNWYNPRHFNYTNFTFYQPVFYATYDQHFPSESEERGTYWVGFEERGTYWVGFGKHCGDAMKHKVLDHQTQKIIYRSAVRPQKASTHNHRLASHGGDISTFSDPFKDKISSGSPLGPSEGSLPNQKPPTVFIRSRDDENPCGSKPMPTFGPEDLIGWTFPLPSEANGERHRGKVTRKVVEMSVGPKTC